MRLCVTGDWHLQKKLLEEGRTFLKRLLVEMDTCDGIAILGDIYQNVYPHPTAIELCVWFLQQIPPDKSIYILGGNHDIKKDANATQWLPLLRPNIVYDAELIDTYITGRRVVMKHTDVAESNVGVTGMHLSTISYKTIEADIILLGHVHKSQIISESPLTLHPGSPYYINFGERTDKEKGYYVLDIREKITVEWRKNPCNSMHQFDIDKKNIKTIQTQIDKIPPESKVKLVFTLEGYSLDTLKKANEIISHNKKIFVDLLYTFNTVYKEVTIEEVDKEKSKTIPQLLEEFCTKEQVDKDIKELLLGMT